LRLAVVGPVRRMRSTVERVHLLATSHDDRALVDAFCGMTFVAEVRGKGEREAAVVLEDGMPVQLTVVAETAWFAALFVRAGGDAHVAAVAARAKDRGFVLGDDGLHEGKSLVRLEEEDDVYRAAGLSFLPPELRETEDATPPPEDLVSIGDVRGIL